MTPIQAIRARCLDCSAFQPKEVRLCPAKDCPLWQYRMGCRPQTYAKKAEQAKKKRQNAILR